MTLLDGQMCVGFPRRGCQVNQIAGRRWCFAFISHSEENYSLGPVKESPTMLSYLEIYSSVTLSLLSRSFLKLDKLIDYVGLSSYLLAF